MSNRPTLGPEPGVFAPQLRRLGRDVRFGVECCSVLTVLLLKHTLRIEKKMILIFNLDKLKSCFFYGIFLTNASFKKKKKKKKR